MLQSAAPCIQLICHRFRKGNLKDVLKQAWLTKEQEPKRILRPPTTDISVPEILPELPEERHPPQSMGDSCHQSCILGGGWLTLWACQVLSREPGSKIFRGVELCRLGLSSGYHRYDFIYKSKLQLLDLSNSNTKCPTDISKHQQNSWLPLDSCHMGLGPVQEPSSSDWDPFIEITGCPFDVCLSPALCCRRKGNHPCSHVEVFALLMKMVHIHFWSAEEWKVKIKADSHH